MILRILVLLFFSTTVYAGSLSETLAPSSQIILVVAKDENSFKAEISQLERAGKNWRQFGSKLPAVLGKDGVATGEGIYSGPEFAAGKVKIEGDRRSPTGVFQVGQVYGVTDANQFKGRMPYRMITANLEGVDDPKSRYYNQIVDRSALKEPSDWKSHEVILRKDRIYRWLLEIRHNPKNTAGRGSLIFLHVWRKPSSGTVGCVAMDEDKLRGLLEWLDPIKQPLLVIISQKNLAAFKQALGATDAW